jgi:hypothetical protein
MIGVRTRSTTFAKSSLRSGRTIYETAMQALDEFCTPKEI